ncbi:hypothetical protein PSPO01_10812 [Paraphaeosphaeria sporulosa]
MAPGTSADGVAILGCCVKPAARRRRLRSRGALASTPARPCSSGTSTLSLPAVWSHPPCAGVADAGATSAEPPTTPPPPRPAALRSSATCVPCARLRLLSTRPPLRRRQLNRLPARERCATAGLQQSPPRALPRQPESRAEDAVSPTARQHHPQLQHTLHAHRHTQGVAKTAFLDARPELACWPVERREPSLTLRSFACTTTLANSTRSLHALRQHTIRHPAFRRRPRAPVASSAPKPIDSRHRHQAQDFVKRDPVQVQEEDSVDDAGEPLLIREHRGRAVMGKAHRLFHRRAAQVTPNILTVNVEVVATLDSAGNVVGQATATPAIGGTTLIPAAVVSTVATDAVVLPSVPSVPAVPPFPSDLNVPSVPAYPWPSGVPTVAAVAATTQAAAPESTPAASLSSVGVFPTASGFNNSTTSITSPSASSSLNSTSSRSSRSSSSSSHSSTLSSTQSSITSSATSAQTTSLAWVASSTVGGGGAGGFADPAGTGATSTPTVAPVTDAGSSGPLETPQVVGTVVGSLAGFALLLWLMLFLIKRHKQKQRGGALQLTGDDQTDREISQPMTQNAARTSFVPPSFLNRFSGASRSTVDTASTGEKSFQRISGRKLPSAFSEGMTSEQFASGRGESTMSGSSFYHDDKGWYGGPGVISKDFGESSFAKEIGDTSNTGAMGTAARVRPSPAQTPVIHHAADDVPVWGAPPRNGGDTLSPPMTPNPDFPPRGSLGRSHPSRDGSTISRSSRFTENV